MESVYVLEPGAYLRREGRSLRVERSGAVVDRIPADGLRRLMLIGYVSLSGPVLDFLIRNRVETVFVTPTGRFRARLALDEKGHVNLRAAQYIHLKRPAVALSAAAAIVRGKIGNMRRMLLLRGRQYDARPLRAAAARLHSMEAAAGRARDLGGLRGVEGAAARIYFEAFPHLIRNPDFTFNGRNRRPPLDPVNALLSFAYTLLTNEALSAIQIRGMDPYLGALHEVLPGRPALACDLVEEYRAFLGDRLVLGLINRRMIGPDDFIIREAPPAAFADEAEMRSKRPVEMRPPVARAFIGAYEELMRAETPYPPLGRKTRHRQLIRHQALLFARFLEDPSSPYEPHSWEA